MKDEFAIERGSVSVPIVSTTVEEAAGSVLMLHGIFSEKSEDGRFTRLADELAGDRYNSWQFDFMGHGDSEVPSSMFTAAAAVADFLIVADAHRRSSAGLPRSVLASSFGGSIVLLAAMSGELEPLGYERIILLNPVTNYRSSFLEPFAQQMQEIFTKEALRRICETGESEVLPGFKLGLPALVEFALLRPADGFPHLTVPVLVLHGDRDMAVSHDVVKEDSSVSPWVQFHTIPGAAHAFAEEPYERISFDFVRNFLRGDASTIP